MADNNEGAGNGAENEKETVEQLREQVANLNKGIAGYRDEAKSAKEEAVKASQAAQQALAKLSEFEKLNEKKDDGAKLTADEERKLAAFAKQQGLVSKSDLDQQRSQAQADQIKGYESQAVAEFLEKHPEYDDDDKWKDIAKEFAVYRAPSTLQGFKQLLERIRKDVSGDAEKGAAAKARAEVISRSKLGIGGGSNRAGDGDDAEAELDRVAKKYPNLTRDQIVDQLAAVRALPAKIKK